MCVFSFFLSLSLSLSSFFFDFSFFLFTFHFSLIFFDFLFFYFSFFFFFLFRVREFRFLLGKICVAHSVAHSFIFLLCCHYRLNMESRPRARGGTASIGEVLCTSLPSETCVNQERPGRA